MAHESPDLVEQLLPKASDLLKNLFSRRVDFDEATRVLEGINLSPAMAPAWNRALGLAAAPIHPELANWAWRKARDAGPADAELLSRLQDSWIAVGNVEEADGLNASLCEALLKEGRPDDLAAPLRRLCESVALKSSAGPFPLDASLVKAALEAARRRGRTEDYLAIRKALRTILGSALRNRRETEDYNLVVLDLDAPGGGRERAVEAFARLIAEPRPGLREMPGGTPDLRFLIRCSGAVHLVEGERSARAQLSPEAFRLALEAAHLPFAPAALPGPDEPLGVESAWDGAALPGDLGSTPRELSAREGNAIAQGVALVPIMVEVLGIQGFSHPEVRKGLDEIRQGAAKFFRSGINSEPGYGRLVSLFCMSNGLTSDFLSFLIRLYNPPYRLSRCEGILGRLEPRDLAHIADTLRKDGIYRFPEPVPADLLEDLIRHGKTAPCYPHPESGIVKEPVIYPEGRPGAVKYDFVERELVPTRAVQRVLADETLLGVSQAYLGAKPVIDAVAMWWSTTFGQTASSEAAQLYHFDMERIRWLKWFIYLTDVDTGTGPHCFVRGSHRTGRKPAHLLQRGYQRISDAEMEAAYPGDILELTGPKGSIFVEDTSGFHKGKHPTTGSRLVIEFEYSNSLYGAPLARETGWGEEIFPPLRAMAARFPQVYCKYSLRP